MGKGRGRFVWCWSEGWFELSVLMAELSRYAPTCGLGMFLFLYHFEDRAC